MMSFYLTTKRALRAALLVLMVTVTATANAQTTFTVDKLNYTVNRNGTSVTLTGHEDGTSASGTLSIPDTVTYGGNSYAVTIIDKGAFRDCSSLTGDLIIPNTVTIIDANAFYSCTGFDGELTIGNSVKIIGTNAFRGCENLTGDLIIPSSVIGIGHRTFYHCTSFNGLLIFEGDVSIKSFAFNECEGFNAVVCYSTTPPTLESDSVFLWTNSPLLFVPCGTGVYYQGWGDFVNVLERCFTEGDLTYFINDNLTTVTVTGHKNDTAATGTLLIPNIVTYLHMDYDVTAIGDSAFAHCTELSPILLNTTTPPTVGIDAFLSWDATTPVFVPCGTGDDYQDWGDFTNIIDRCFTAGDLNYYINENLTTVTVTGHKDGTAATGTLSIPDSVFYANFTYALTAIGDTAFSGCTGITSIILNTTTPPTVGTNSFKDWDATTPVFVPCGTGMDYQGWGAFTNIIDRCITVDDLTYFINEDLATVNVTGHVDGVNATGTLLIPDSVTYLNIDFDVTAIGDSAFAHCTELSPILLHATTPPTVGAGSFEEWNASTQVFVPCGTGDDYQHWGGFSNIFDRCFTVGDLNYFLNEDLATVIVTGHKDGTAATGTLSIPEIVDYAFLSLDLIAIGDTAFSGCTDITSIVSYATTSPILGNDAFLDMSDTIPVFVPCGSGDDYLRYWGTWFSDFTEMCPVVALPEPIDMGHRPAGCWMRPFHFDLTNKNFSTTVITDMELVGTGSDAISLDLGDVTLPVNLATDEILTLGMTWGSQPDSVDCFLKVTYTLEEVVDSAMLVVLADVYDPATGDVWENPKMVSSFPYSDTLNTADIPLYDNYVLPDTSLLDGNDVVYKLEIEHDLMLSASVTGDNGKAYLYEEGFQDVGGPDEDNFYYYQGAVVNNNRGGWHTYGEGERIKCLDRLKTWAVMFPAGSYHGSSVVKVADFGAQNSDGAFTGKVSIYNNGTNAPSDLVASMEISMPCTDDLVEFEFPTPVAIDNTKNLWVVFTNNQPNGNYASVCEDSGDPNGRWLYHNNAWRDLANSGQYYSWSMRVYLADFIVGPNVTYMPLTPGTYYLAASSTSDEFIVSINADEMPCPEPAFNPTPADETINVSEIKPNLQWEINDYTTEYCLLFGDDPDNLDTLVDWTRELRLSYTINDTLNPGTTYYWQVGLRNEGCTDGVFNEPWSFSTPCATPKNLYISRTGYAMWDKGVDGQRHFVESVVTLTEMDGDTLYTGTTDQSYMQLPIDTLTDNEFYLCHVRNVYTVDTSENVSQQWFYQTCDHFEGVIEPVGIVDPTGIEFSWSYPESQANDTANTTNDGWYYYDDGTPVTPTSNIQKFAIRIPAGSYQGNILDKVSVFAHEDLGVVEGTITIYNDGNNAPSNPVDSMVVVIDGSHEFIEYEFTKPLVIDSTKNVWVVCALEGDKAVASRNNDNPNGRWMYNGTEWRKMGASYQIGWMLRAEILEASPMGDPIGVDIYRDGEWLCFTSDTNYFDPEGTFERNYELQLRYDGDKECPINNAYYTFCCLQEVNLVGREYTISASANPSVCGTILGTGVYHYLDSCTLTVSTNYGYHFENWTMNQEFVSASESISFIVTQDSSFVANFERNSYQINAYSSNTLEGTVTGGGEFLYGDTCTLVATPLSTYNFHYWRMNGDQVSFEPVYSFAVTEDQTYYAYFGLLRFTVNALINPDSTGTVNGTGIYEYGSLATVTAIPEPGYYFVNWTQNGSVVSTNTSYSVRVTNTVVLTANFDFVDYEINATANPLGGGEITGTGTYHINDSCTLTASAATGYHFVNWTLDGEIVGTDPTYSFMVTGSANYVANYEVNTYEITVEASPTQFGSVQGAGTYEHFETCTLTATPVTGYHLVNWTLNGVEVSTEESYSFTVSGAGHYVANFALNSYVVSAIASPTAGGTVNGTGTYQHLAQCTLTATAATGYHFVSWTLNGNVVSTSLTYQFDVTATATYVANFSLNGYDITAEANPVEGGTVEITGSNEHYGLCTLTAIPATGYHFVNWTLEGTEVGTELSYSFTVTGAAHYVANFEINSYEITATVNPSVGGSVGGTGTYDHFETCTLTAIPAPGYYFVNWTLDGVEVSTEESYSFVVAGAAEYVANFDLSDIHIGAITSSAEQGTVTGGGDFHYGENCTLVATPNYGYQFLYWRSNGNQVSNNATYSFVVYESANYIAYFRLNRYTITTYANPINGGTVQGGGLFEHGSTCTLTATAEPGYEFINWTCNGEVVSTTPTYSFTVTRQATYIANFVQGDYDITVAANPAEGGTVTGGGSYQQGTTATLIASANDHYQFVNWTHEGEVVSVSETYSFVVTANGYYVANFEEVTQHNISVEEVEGVTINVPALAYTGDLVTVVTESDSLHRLVSLYYYTDDPTSVTPISLNTKQFVMPNANVTIGGESMVANKGDANLDGVVDILDVLVTIDYIRGNNPQPFSFENADMNNDNVIDMTDVMAINALIHNQKGACNDFTALYDVINGKLYVESNAALAGIQLTLSMEPTVLDLPGFAAAGNWKDGEYVLCLYNLNAELEPGQYAVLDLNGGQVADMLAATSLGCRVWMEKGTLGVNVLDEHAYTVYPIPARDQVTLEGPGIQTVEVYNAMGQRVMMLREVNADRCQVNVGTLSSGSYLLRIGTLNGIIVKSVNVVR